MNALIVLSGGQDSTTCLYWAKDRGYHVHAVTFDYGQRHDREIASAYEVARYGGVESHETINIMRTLKGSSPLVSDSPLEQYRDHHALPDGIEKTFVPLRNQLFLTVAANRAYVNECDVIVTGVSAEDYGGYPDCRPGFILALEHTINLGTFTGEDGTRDPIRIATPLMNKTKAESIHMALQFPQCYEALALTHTSYDGSYPPTGKDHATLLRAKGFEEAGVPDPLVLRAYLEGLIHDLPESKNYDMETWGEEFYLDRVNKVIEWRNEYHV